MGGGGTSTGMGKLEQFSRALWAFIASQPPAPRPSGTIVSDILDARERAKYAIQDDRPYAEAYKVAEAAFRSTEIIGLRVGPSVRLLGTYGAGRDTAAMRSLELCWVVERKGQRLENTMSAKFGDSIFDEVRFVAQTLAEQAILSIVYAEPPSQCVR